MEPEPPVLESLRSAVQAMPDDVPLRVHLATMLMNAGLHDEAVRHVGAILQRDPGNAAALALLQAPDPSPRQDQAPGPDLTPDPEQAPGFDWSQAESDVQGLLPPMFVSDDPAADDNPAARAFDVEQTGLRLADVAGMAEVKQRLEAAFLAPMRNTPMRSAVNQLLLELDDVTAGNDGVFLLAATNHPWDVDSALRRPGRFDRTLLVLPPDRAAREAVFGFHLRERPVGGVNLARLAELTEGYSGADIAHICEASAEHALLDSVQQGTPRLIGQADLERAVSEGHARPQAL